MSLNIRTEELLTVKQRLQEAYDAEERWVLYNSARGKTNALELRFARNATEGALECQNAGRRGEWLLMKDIPTTLKALEEILGQPGPVIDRDQVSQQLASMPVSPLLYEPYIAGTTPKGAMYLKEQDLAAALSNGEIHPVAWKTEIDPAKECDGFYVVEHRYPVGTVYEIDHEVLLYERCDTLEQAENEMKHLEAAHPASERPAPDYVLVGSLTGKYLELDMEGHPLNNSGLVFQQAEPLPGDNGFYTYHHTQQLTLEEPATIHHQVFAGYDAQAGQIVFMNGALEKVDPAIHHEEINTLYLRPDKAVHQLPGMELKDTFVQALSDRMAKADWHYEYSDGHREWAKGSAEIKEIKEDLNLLSRLDGGLEEAKKLWEEHVPPSTAAAPIFFKEPQRLESVLDGMILTKDIPAVQEMLLQQQEKGNRFVAFEHDPIAVPKGRFTGFVTATEAHEFTYSKST